MRLSLKCGWLNYDASVWVKLRKQAVRVEALGNRSDGEITRSGEFCQQLSLRLEKIPLPA